MSDDSRPGQSGSGGAPDVLLSRRDTEAPRRSPRTMAILTAAGLAIAAAVVVPQLGRDTADPAPVPSETTSTPADAEPSEPIEAVDGQTRLRLVAPLGADRVRVITERPVGREPSDLGSDAYIEDTPNDAETPELALAAKDGVVYILDAVQKRMDVYGGSKRPSVPLPDAPILGISADDDGVRLRGVGAAAWTLSGRTWTPVRPPEADAAGEAGPVLEADIVANDGGADIRLRSPDTRVRARFRLPGREVTAAVLPPSPDEVRQGIAWVRVSASADPSAGSRMRHWLARVDLDQDVATAIELQCGPRVSVDSSPAFALDRKNRAVYCLATGWRTASSDDLYFGRLTRHDLRGSALFDD